MQPAYNLFHCLFCAPMPNEPRGVDTFTPLAKQKIRVQNKDVSARICQYFQGLQTFLRDHGSRMVKAASILELKHPAKLETLEAWQELRGTIVESLDTLLERGDEWWEMEPAQRDAAYVRAHEAFVAKYGEDAANLMCQVLTTFPPSSTHKTRLEILYKSLDAQCSLSDSSIEMTLGDYEWICGLPTEAQVIEPIVMRPTRGYLTLAR